jgi:glycerate 2-kinase
VRVLLAFDKFKDSLTARQACDLAAQALQAERPDWQLDLCPLADGGEGFAEILTQAAQGESRSYSVAGPRGHPLTASLGLVRLDQIPAAARSLLQLGLPGSAQLALVEMAAASGLALLAPADRDPWQTTSQGTGQLIRAAAELGAGAVLLGVGGSATNDLGLGALGALGLAFLTADGRRLEAPVPAFWPQLARIEGRADPALPPIRIACDVANPLLGPRGATAIFGPQKGLVAADYVRLETECARVAGLLSAHCGQVRDLAQTPGAGAAGGIAFGLMTAAAAQLLPGADLVASWLDLDARLARADLVITGEGSFDASSWGGKGPGALVSRALALGKPAQVFAGRVETDRIEPGVALHGITPAGTPLPEALRRGGPNLLASIRRAFAGVSGPGPSGG